MRLIGWGPETSCGEGFAEKALENSQAYLRLPCPLGAVHCSGPTTSGYRACSTPDMKTAPQDAQAQATHLCGDKRPQGGSAKEVSLRGCCSRRGFAGWPPRGFALVDTRGGL